jgi:hypothetical protein
MEFIAVELIEHKNEGEVSSSLLIKLIHVSS